MASRQPERYIPHVMDVFRVPFTAAGSRSDGVGEDPGTSSRYGEPYDSRTRGKRRPDTTATTSATSDARGHVPNYSHQARTLTERDIKHIERHLSMKKTIRKQLSRHLSQAFVESNAEPSAEDPLPVTSQGRAVKTARPETSSAMSETNGWNSNFTVRQTGRHPPAPDQTFLALLKDGSARRDDDDDDDSGHCSPTAELDLVLSQWGGGQEVDRRRLKDPWAPASDPYDRPVTAAASAADLPKKSSFWKKLTIRTKSKR